MAALWVGSGHLLARCSDPLEILSGSGPVWRRLLLGLALCGTAQAAPPPRIDLVVMPAWKGWSRPGRTTELDIRLTTDTATRATLDVVAGRQSGHVDVDLRPGRAVRLHLPVGSAQAVAVSAAAPGGPPGQREVSIAQSESPLLGVGLATDDGVQLEGFHTVALAADDLPRNASAYASIDALILDTPTLSALDQQQLGALVAHAAGCGRIVVVNTDARVRRVLDGAGGCGGHALMSATSLTQAKEMLDASLAVNLAAPMSPGGIGQLAPPDPRIWNRVAVIVAAYFAVAALAVLFFSTLPVLLALPALATVAVLALLHAMPSSSQLVVWSEGASGTQLARYQAWQRFQGLVRGQTRVAIPPQLASAALPCDSAQAMRFAFDADRGQALSAGFETRLFRQVSLCYSGSFPMTRAIAIQAHSDGLRDVQNAGTTAWPDGVVLAGGLAHSLPALGPGAHTTIGPNTGKPLRDAVLRAAMARTPPDGVAALWALDLSGVAAVPIDSTGWLLVSLPLP